ncbi:hypothetical protein JDV02_008623 [Purpureocillium takamizusanense]|uniref:DUF8035 domain-containing protein n=1 Tax=Purpureocillium takamizusanense TaxID=2060973 RepID=A0A9Q8QQR3_9HYPO|nr:uncharacterized protein JDV02_008623 [Purpureocillium takamizusanense]UNI22762.1 hypothetical protein JDV02_008623 [Purpureocillium takamizusanense]
MAGERWDRDRFMYERDRVEDDRYYMRGGRSRDHSDERHDRRRYHDDDLVRDRRYYDDEPRFDPRRERAPPGPDYDRRVVMEKERDREYYREPSPRRPAFLRRQSSLDTFDRRPLRRIYEPREEYPPPARREDIYREDYRAPPYTPIPLPKTRALPPPRHYRDRGFYDDINVVDPDRYGDDEYRPYPERVREREMVRERERRDRSRESHSTRTRTHRGSSRSSSTTSRSSSSAGGTTVRSEYPKKGKTKIPVKLVSKRALIDLGYPFVEEGNTIIVQKALGQDNIDELLKLSEEYNKAELEVAAARSSAGAIEERKEEFVIPPPPVTVPAPPPPPPPQVVVPPPPPAPVIVDAAPAAPAVEIIDKTKTVIREASPARTVTTSTSYDSYPHHHHHHHHHDELIVGPVVERSRSRSRSGRDIRAEIRALERELVHRPRADLGEREIIRTERLPDGQLVVYEEKVEREVAGPKPPRIEKDKKGPPPRLVRAMLSTLT